MVEHAFVLYPFDSCRGDTVEGEGDTSHTTDIAAMDFDMAENTSRPRVVCR